MKIETDAPITIDEVKLVMSNLKVNESAGPDRTINEELKHSQPVLAIYIVKILHLILKTGKEPDLWKLSLYKKVTMETNYGNLFIPFHKRHKQ